MEYSIISTSGLHYRYCDSVWEAFRLVRGYSTRFIVQREDSAGRIRRYDRTGREVFRGAGADRHSADCQCTKCSP